MILAGASYAPTKATREVFKVGGFQFVYAEAAQRRMVDLSIRDRFISAYIANLDAGKVPTMPLYEACMLYARKQDGGEDAKGWATQYAVDTAEACERGVKRVQAERAGRR